MKIRHLVSAVYFFVLPSFSYAVPPAHSSSISITDKQINLNTADIKLLTKSVKGIGTKRAESIIKYRQEHGNFKAVNDLAQVPGFGQKFINSHLEELERVFTVK
ncbi:competence protein ComEA [Legionella busanensis]|uniref:Competence protein ComEA n=1 Tax=Legionella busanensis TaxID=190655 RepID=A0A378JIF4_9GAMM|nr:helix-hairpin-helix domain-containing protein [Legionella busanensis]STX50827.1 competence protein ComEA [Legionella busanensis]